MIDYSVKQKRILEDHEKELKDIRVKTHENFELLTQILNVLQGENTLNNVSQTTGISVEKYFPINDEETLLKVEQLIVEDINNRLLLVR